MQIANCKLCTSLYHSQTLHHFHNQFIYIFILFAHLKNFIISYPIPCLTSSAVYSSSSKLSSIHTHRIFYIKLLCEHILLCFSHTKSSTSALEYLKLSAGPWRKFSDYISLKNDPLHTLYYSNSEIYTLPI